jgi:hypothetical protein
MRIDIPSAARILHRARGITRLSLLPRPLPAQSGEADDSIQPAVGPRQE